MTDKTDPNPNPSAIEPHFKPRRFTRIPIVVLSLQYLGDENRVDAEDFCSTPPPADTIPVNLRPGTEEYAAFVRDHTAHHSTYNPAKNEFRVDDKVCNPGDFIVRVGDLDFHPVNQAVFRATYVEGESEKVASAAQAKSTDHKAPDHRK